MSEWLVSFKAGPCCIQAGLPACRSCWCEDPPSGGELTGFEDFLLDREGELAAASVACSHLPKQKLGASAA